MRKLNVQIPKYGVSGDYRVKSAQHTLSNNSHKISVTIDFSGANFTDPTQAS